MNRAEKTCARRSRVMEIFAALSCLALLALPMPTQAGPIVNDEAGAAIKQVDLNRASEEELMRVPGIGEIMAGRIVAFRDEHGPFKRVEDLMKIKGIGEKSFQKLSAHVKVSRPKKK